MMSEFDHVIQDHIR
jgi:hypothetical protein